MTTPGRAPRPAPQRYQFSVEDRERYELRFWKAPRRLVTGGLWARLWRGDGSRRGGGIATSVLPVLALHTWPGKKDMDGSSAGVGAEPGWTGWTYLSRRRIARLAGVDKDAATAAFTRLCVAGLMQTQRVPRGKYEGGYRTYYRLSVELYPWGVDDPYAQIVGNLFYGGAWSILPSAAARHMYVVLACLDPIADEPAYLQKIADDMDGERWNEMPGAEEVWSALSPQLPRGLAEEHRFSAWIAAIEADVLSRRRQQSPVSLTELERLTAMNRSTVSEALQVLTTPVFGRRIDQSTGTWIPPIALVSKGVAGPRKPTWYAPDRRVHRWHWIPEFLNDAPRVDARRRELWPQLLQRRARVAGVLGRLNSSPPPAAWREARDLAELRDRRTRAKLPASPSDLARETRRSTSVVEQALRIASDLTHEVFRIANADEQDVDRLSRAALIRVVRSGGTEGRAQTLTAELRKVRAGS